MQIHAGEFYYIGLTGNVLKEAVVLLFSDRPGGNELIQQF